MAAAMGKTVQVTTAHPHQLGNGDGTRGALPIPDLLDAEAEQVVADSAIQAEPAAPVKKRGTGPKRDYNAGIELVPNLDFRPANQPSLRDFFAARVTKSDMEQVLIMLYFMQHHMKVAKIGLGHIRTAFKEVNKPLPIDLRSTLRNMKKQKAWVAFDNTDNITLTTLGDNYVEHDLPKSAAE